MWTPHGVSAPYRPDGALTAAHNDGGGAPVKLAANEVEAVLESIDGPRINNVISPTSRRSGRWLAGKITGAINRFTTSASACPGAADAGAGAGVGRTHRRKDEFPAMLSHEQCNPMADQCGGIALRQESRTRCAAKPAGIIERQAR
jgi:hypothetical protein